MREGELYVSSLFVRDLLGISLKFCLGGVVVVGVESL